VHKPEEIERILKLRSQTFKTLRSFFDERDFLEADTPQLITANAVERHIDPLVVQAGQARQLITSPELAMKRLMSKGAKRLYQLGHVFRAGEHTKRHRIEFTLLEWYRADADLKALIDDLQSLFLRFGLPSRFAVRTVKEAFESVLDLDLDAILDDDPTAFVPRLKARKQKGQKGGFDFRPEADFEDAFFECMHAIEKSLENAPPTILIRWPKAFAALAKSCSDDDRYAERFELYFRGLELANAFDELTDPIEQRARFEEDNQQRLLLGKKALPIDEEFIEALSKMPRTSGIALGVDRLMMVLTQTSDIAAVRYDF